MAWHGAAPDEMERAEQLQPGAHRVKLTGWRELDSGKFVVTLSNKHGEAAEWIPFDITPMTKEEREAYKSRHGFYHEGWKGWRLLGAFDYPNADYWRKPADTREALTWDLPKAFDEILQSGREAWIRTTTKVDKKNQVKAQIANAKSIVRHGEELGVNLPPPGGSILDPKQPEKAEKEDSEKNMEVPF